MINLREIQDSDKFQKSMQESFCFSVSKFFFFFLDII